MHRRSRRLTLRLQLTSWFVVALIAVEGTVLFGFWVAREEPLIDTTVQAVRLALEEVRLSVERRDLYIWRWDELSSLAMRAEIDLLAIVAADGSSVTGDEAMFPRTALMELVSEGSATWTLAAVEREDPRGATVLPGAPADPPTAVPGPPEAPPRGPATSEADGGEPPPQAPQGGQPSVLKLPEWPVVGACVPFRDVFGRRAYLVGASTAPAAAPPLVIRAVTWMGLIGLFSATVAAWVMLGRALRPLKQLAESALRISAERRDERLAVQGEQVEVARAKRALNEALDRLEGGYDALDLFIGNVTHELRTPIAAVLAEARQLALRARTEEEYQAFVHSTGDEMARLSKMIESFLTLARMDWEERRGMVVPVSLLDLAVEVGGNLQASAKQQQVSIVLQLSERDDLEVDGDPELLTSMVDNVVRNAVRFSPTGGQVHVTVDGGLAEATLVVRDHGPGIPETLAEVAFQPFVHGGPAPRGGRGSGIGLAIAQKVAELHRGKIRIGNHAEGGCEVTITLPLRSFVPADA